MNRTIYILFILLALASCTATKRSASSVSQSADSSAQQSSGDVVVYRERIIRDTVLTIAERIVHDTIPIEAPCKLKPFYHEKTVNGLKAWVGLDNQGRLDYGASSDSFTIVVRNLVQKRDSFSALYRQQQFINRMSHQEQTTEVVKTKKTFADWLLSNLWGIAAIVILLFVIIRSLKRMYLW